MMQINLTDNWVQVVSNATVFVCQPRAECTVFVGSSAPEPSFSIGFDMDSSEPRSIPNLAELGGSVWVKGKGTLVYATDV